ncbi:uncharacterized protein LOC116767725 [Danaus plexippus]|uniref:uncharacterized protein LOC116767725 n=1 Tax=Danaus plexippus TaxID=13037 RepID=UPI002AAF71D9|nr:uncharacterized protein LOC116767725 [Danaus plexippus]
MYIAFKWLMVMALAMWLCLCFVDIYQNKIYDLINIEFKVKSISAPMFKNLSAKQQQPYKRKETLNLRIKNGDNNLFQYVMFVAGACMVLIYNKKNHIILYSTETVRRINIILLKKIIVIIKESIPFFTGTVIRGVQRSLKAINKVFIKIKAHTSSIYSMFRQENYKKVNIVLLEKLKELGQERKNLSQLLMAAIQENKNIRMRCQLENLAKNRLARHIENTQKQIKENKTRYVNFQQLYLTTHQENIFLKSRMKNLTREKDEAERNLIKLVNQVCQSKNNDLKAYCSRFIVRTKDNLLNSDVRSEIQQFLQKPGQSSDKSSDIAISHKLTECPSKKFELAETLQNDENLIDLVEDAPKLRGLPGECVWTVKDKEGMIQKLYEYETEFDNGDTIRRIRQYSVYHDKDCLLDFSNSTTFIRNSNIDISTLRKSFVNTDSKITSQKFLTDSPAFQNFLQNNKNIALREPLAFAPSLKC